jgi:ferritin-like metal-binding protein YciE
MSNQLEQLLVNELQDLYSAEKQILRALPRMVKAATHDDLRRALEEHRVQTEGHVERLDQVFEHVAAKPGNKKCKGMAGLLEEGDERLEEEDPMARDAGIIAAAQRVEHYEMAAYGTARTYARLLGRHEAAHLLQATLEEEGQADRRLTEIAETSVNQEAATAS